MRKEKQPAKVRKTKEVISDRTHFLSHTKIIENFEIYSFTNHKIINKGINGHLITIRLQTTWSITAQVKRIRLA